MSEPIPAAQHLRWLRSEGLVRVLEEKDVAPIEHTRNALARRAWRRRHGPSSTTTPVWVVGQQRSGTNLLMRLLARNPECEIRNEDDRESFVDYRLRSREVLAGQVARSPHRFVVYKPLCDSHRVGELLDDPTLGPGRALWMVRGVDGRARSAASRFGGHARDVLEALASGDERPWQAGGVDGRTRTVVASLDPTRLDDLSAQALLWWVRNDLLFRLELAGRSDLLVVGYERLAQDPHRELERVGGFVGFALRPAMVRGVQARGPGAGERLPIALAVRELCDELTDRLAPLTTAPPR